MECNRVSKKECKVARQRALKLLNFVQQEISKNINFHIDWLAQANGELWLKMKGDSMI